MKTYNIWQYKKEQTGPTGPWEFVSACLAVDEKEALECARMRHGFEHQYNIYEGL